MQAVRFRAGLVGAGYISEYHVAALRRLGNVDLVGVFDLDRAKAERLASSTKTKAYPSLEALCQANVDVIHVLTPPDSHCAVALRGVELGCHVLVEKPLATDTAACEALHAAAEVRGRRVCVNHSLLFDPQVRRALDFVRKGRIGQVVSVDIVRSSVYLPYRGGPLPPQYRSAGYPFRDLGCHALYLMQAFLGPIENVTAEWRSLGGDPNLAFDEWRSIVRCRDGNGQCQLSWNVKPLQSQLIVQGTKGVLRADLFLMSQTCRSPFPIKAVERVLNALSDSIPLALDVPGNILRFLTKRALPYHGLQDLVRAFYDALATGGSMPVSITDALTVVYWTESIAQAADREHRNRLSQIERRTLVSAPEEQKDLVVITGGSGNVGNAVARALLNQGRRVRLFVRRMPNQIPGNAEVVFGNLGDFEAVKRALYCASTVIHAGAAMKGSWADHECATVTGTRNVLEACQEFGVHKLVHISSMSVIDWAGTRSGALLDETTAIEPRAEARGAYARAKLEAEQLVTDYIKYHGVPGVILRPGTILSPCSPLNVAIMGRKVRGRWILLGDGTARVPLIYLDDLVDAIITAVNSELHGGEIIQIIDDDQPTQDELLRIIEGPEARVFHVPRTILYLAGALSQVLLSPLHQQSPISTYRLAYVLSACRFQSRNAQSMLHWRPRVGLTRGMFQVHT